MRGSRFQICTDNEDAIRKRDPPQKRHDRTLAERDQTAGLRGLGPAVQAETKRKSHYYLGSTTPTLFTPLHAM
jgi:hypothetical protein